MCVSKSDLDGFLGKPEGSCRFARSTHLLSEVHRAASRCARLKSTLSFCWVCSTTYFDGVVVLKVSLLCHSLGKSSFVGFPKFC